MKKSLSLILAIAMVFSMFASVAFAADASLDTNAKYEDLKKAGIFEGTDGGAAALDQAMTRAQFAKVIVKLLGLQEDAASASIFNDLTGAGWATGFIGAAVKAGLVDGVAAGKFDPSANVSTEQLAKLLVLGLKLQPSTDAVTGNVSAWAKGYVAAAVKAGLIPASSDYTKPALRSALVEATYAAKNYVAPTAKVSVTEAKATGIKTVQVTFNKAVDDTKAKLAVKKGSIDVATTVKFADDKKSATLTLTDVKLSEGTYTVTLSGLDAIDKASAEFKAENEKVTKIEFLSANDTIAKAAKVIVKLKASNQYGENASFSAGNYTVYAGNSNDVYVKLAKADSGELLLTLNTTVSGYTPGISIIPVNIYDNDAHVTASKNFKLGTEPFVSKLELGAVKYSNGKDALGGKGESATFDVINYDQYGNVIPYNSTTDITNTRVVFSNYEPNLTYEVGDSNSDDVTDVKISLINNVDKSGDYNFTVYNQAGTATAKVIVKSAKVATKLELGELTDVIAAGDDDAYIPLVAYDASGAQLSVDDLVSSENVDDTTPVNSRIKVSAGGITGTAAIQTAGEHKGQIKLTGISSTPKSIVSVTAFLATPNASSTVTKTYTVSDARIPDKIDVVTDPAKKFVAGAESKFEFRVKDQYGKQLDEFKNVDAGGVVTVSTGSGVAQYRLAVTTEVYGATAPTVAKNAEIGGNFAASQYYAGTTGTSTPEFFNKEHKFVTTASVTSDAYASITAVIEKTTNNWSTSTEVSNKITRKIESIKSTDSLSYNVSAVSDLFNAVDSDSVITATYDTGLDLLATTQEDPTASKFAKEVKITATDAAGNTVALPKTIKSLTSSNVEFVKTGIVSGKGYVIGNKKGSATVNVAFSTYKGETVVKSLTVNTKDDAITSTKLVVNKKSRTVAEATTLVNAFQILDLDVVDNYGVTYENIDSSNVTKKDSQKYNYLFGIVFAVKNVKGTNATVQVDQYGNLTFGGTVTSFELTATSASGLSVTTFVSN